MNEVKFAVIVVAYSSDEVLSRALESLLCQDIGRGQLEICVVENRSHAESKRRYKDRVDVWLEPGTNLGASGGRNLGVENTTFPILAFIEDDGVADPSFFTSMKRLLLQRPDAIVVRGRIVALKYPMISMLSRAYDLGNAVRECMLDIEGATCIRRTDYVACGGYNAGIFHGEGIELQERLLEQRPDGVILYNPEAVLRHDFAVGLWDLWEKGCRIAKADKRPLTLFPLSEERWQRLRKQYPVKRPSLPVRLYKAPVEIVLRLSIYVHRYRAKG